MHNEKGQERHGNYINGFSERNLIQSNLVILEQKWYSVLLTWLIGVRRPSIVTCDRARFFGKNPHWAKITKNDQKWPKNRVFGLFKKIMSLVLTRICVKGKFLWFINFLQKLHAWEKSGSQFIAKNCSWPMRFQYSLIVNISLIDKYLTLIFGM